MSVRKFMALQSSRPCGKADKRMGEIEGEEGAPSSGEDNFAGCLMKLERSTAQESASNSGLHGKSGLMSI